MIIHEGKSRAHARYANQLVRINSKTKGGKWAGCGDPYRFDDYHCKDLKAVRLEFNEPVSFDLSTLDAERIKKQYPEPYFTITNNRAFCIMGAYVDELFQVKKQGVLKAKGIFE